MGVKDLPSPKRTSELAEIVRGRYFSYVSASEELRKKVGRELRQKRKEAGFRTQRDLARAAGLNVETISRLENGANVEVATLYKVLDTVAIHGTTPDYDYPEEFDKSVAAIQTQEELNAEECGWPLPVIAEGELPPPIGERPPEISAWMPRPGTMLFDKTAYAVNLTSNSLEPIISHGNVVALTRRASIRRGDIVYAQLKTGSRAVRLAYPQGGGYVLASNASSDPPTFCSADSIVDLHRCVHIWMK